MGTQNGWILYLFPFSVISPLRRRSVAGYTRDEQRRDGGQGKQRGCQSREQLTDKITTINFEHRLTSSRAFPTIVCAFCLHAFTKGGKSQKSSRLRVKASDGFSFTAFTDFAFTDNSLILNGLHPSVKAVKAKNTTFM